jgi:O-antigen biosynthesis protein
MQGVMTRIKKILKRSSLRAFIKRIYYFFAPSGSKRYLMTHTFLRRLLNFRYKYWIKHFDSYSKEDLRQFYEKSLEMPLKPQFSVIMPVFNTPIKYLDQAIQSVRKQVYPYWELCIADDASTDPKVRKIIKSHCQEDVRIRSVFRDQNGHISAASNSALDLATGEYIALLDHDDMLHPLALYYAADEINRAPDIEIIYSDEDKITNNGSRISPYFKSDFDYDLLLGQNMVSHIGVYRTETVRQVGGFRIGFEGSQDYDLLLRIIEKIKPSQICHIPQVLYHWRITKQSVAISVDVKPYAVQAATRALSEHLENQNIKASVEPFRDFGYKINYSIPDPTPSIELFLEPKRINKTLFESLRSLVENTDYPHFSVSLITTEAKLDCAAINDIKKIDHLQIRLTDTEMESIKLNPLINASSADYIGIIDENCISYSNRWLGHMISVAVQRGVGAVSPKLIYQNGLIHSCGVILGANGIADHLFYGLTNDTVVNYYYGWDSLNKGYSALPVGCIIVKHEHYSNVGGLNQNLNGQTAQIIDFCLKLRESGLRNIVVPDAIVTVNQTSESFGMENQETLLFCKRIMIIY